MMNAHIRNRLVIAVVALQMLFFAGWYAVESGRFGAPAQTILVRTMPYDPRDLLSGQYLRVNYPFSRITSRWGAQSGPPDWSAAIAPKSGSHEKREEKEVWVLLSPKDGFYEPVSASFTKPASIPAGSVVIRGRTSNYWRIEYGIEKYFVPEGTPEPGRDDEVTAELHVHDSGKARISRLFVDGKEWP